MYRAGIKNITLYENNGITAYYYDPLNLRKISNLSTVGATIQIYNNQHPEYDIKISRSDSGKLVHDYELKFMLLGLTLENYDLIDQIKSSLYGWCFLVEYYDNTFRYYGSPLFADDSEIKPQKEMSFEVKLKTIVPSRISHLEYTPGISTIPVYRADTTLISADNTIYTADYAL